MAKSVHSDIRPRGLQPSSPLTSHMIFWAGQLAWVCLNFLVCWLGKITLHPLYRSEWGSKRFTYMKISEDALARGHHSGVCRWDLAMSEWVSQCPDGQGFNLGNEHHKHHIGSTLSTPGNLVNSSREKHSRFFLCPGVHTKQPEVLFISSSLQRGIFGPASTSEFQGKVILLLHNSLPPSFSWVHRNIILPCSRVLLFKIFHSCSKQGLRQQGEVKVCLSCNSDLKNPPTGQSGRKVLNLLTAICLHVELIRISKKTNTDDSAQVCLSLWKWHRNFPTLFS